MRVRRGCVRVRRANRSVFVRSCLLLCVNGRVGWRVRVTCGVVCICAFGRVVKFSVHGHVVHAVRASKQGEKREENERGQERRKGEEGSLRTSPAHARVRSAVLPTRDRHM